MPIYEYQCVECGSRTEAYRSLRDRERVAICPTCGGDAQFVLATSRWGRSGSYPYMDEFMDTRPVEITSRSHYIKELKKRGLREKERGKGNRGQWV